MINDVMYDLCSLLVDFFGGKSFEIDWLHGGSAHAYFERAKMEFILWTNGDFVKLRRAYAIKEDEWRIASVCDQGSLDAMKDAVWGMIHDRKPI